MIYSGRKQVTTAGTPVPLVSTRTAASWLTVVALRDNDGIVYVGGVDETSKACAVVKGAATMVGHPLIKPNAATDASDFCTFWSVDGLSYIDVSQVYIDADNNGDGVAFNYGRR